MIGSHSDGDSSGNSDVGKSLIKKLQLQIVEWKYEIFDIF